VNKEQQERELEFLSGFGGVSSFSSTTQSAKVSLFSPLNGRSFRLLQAEKALSVLQRRFG
jgi:hypothetical protein